MTIATTEQIKDVVGTTVPISIHTHAAVLGDAPRRVEINPDWAGGRWRVMLTIGPHWESVEFPIYPHSLTVDGVLALAAWTAGGALKLEEL